MTSGDMAQTDTCATPSPRAFLTDIVGDGLTQQATQWAEDTYRDRGCVMWMTGLSGAGKTTVAARVGSELETRGFIVEYLDGDVVREHLSADLGFSRVDRNINVERIAWVASRVARAGAIVIVSAISPYSEARQQARAMVEKYAPFVEIYVSTPLEVCMHRDPKGLYRKAVAGEISRFTGISDPYEPPREPDIEIDTSRISPTEAAQLIREHLERLGTSVPGSKQPQVVAAP